MKKRMFPQITNSRKTAAVPRVSFPMQFAATGLLFLLPLALLLRGFQSEINRGIRVAEMEREGIAYSRPLTTLLLDVSEGRRDIRADLRAVDWADREYGDALGARADWRRLRAEGQGLDTGGPGHAAGTDGAARDHFSQHLLALLNTVGNNSNLILDPDTDSYYTMDTVLTQTPLLVINVSRARAVAGGTDVPDVRQARLAMLTGQIQTPVAAAGADLRMATGYDPALRPRVAAPYQDLQSSTATFTGLLDRFGSSPRFHAEIRRAGDGVFESGRRYDEAGLDALDWVLERRLQTFLSRRTDTDLVAAISTCLAIVFFCGLYRTTMRTIRQLLQAQREVRRSEERYRLLFERSPLPMWVYNRQTLAFLAVNEAAVRRYGYSREEFLSLSLLDIRPAEDRAAVRQSIFQPQESRVWRHLTRAGDLLWVEVTSHPLVWEMQDACMVIAQDITARLEAEESLRQAQARLQTVVDNAPLILFCLDAQGVFTLSEGKGLTLLGLEPGQVVGLSAFEVYADDTPVLAEIRRALAGEDITYVAEVRGLSWEVRCRPMRGEDGTPHGLIGTAFDITERRQAQEGLDRMAAIVHSSHDAVVGWDADRRVTSWNPGAERLYGWTEEEMLGRGLETLMPPEREAERRDIAARMLAGQAVEIPDTTRLRKDGTRVEVSVSWSLVRDAQGRVIGASSIARDISAQKQAEAEQKKAVALIRWQAYTDPLTCLPNRARFGEELDAAIARSEPFALLFIDLDLFKHVNDSLGHVAGDHMLQQVANRFAERHADHGGPLDVLARMGGDEFTLLLVPEGGRPAGEDAATAAADLLDSLLAPITVGGNDLHVAASIGISRFPEDGADAETLLKHADLAMYHAKAEGRGRWRSFAPAMTEAAEDRLRLENSLRKAIERPGGEDGGMTLFYQPQVSLATGEIVGAEALVRWHHPAWGMVAPGRFIPLAEETGLIIPLGDWVLCEACRQAAVWAREGRSLRVSVNLSARQLGERSLVPSVRAALDASGLDPHWLDLELTESALIENLGGKGMNGKEREGDAQNETAAGRLAALRALGIRLSVDDFGTGYSSLSYLRRLPLDILKVDRSFVMGLAGDNNAGDNNAGDKDAGDDGGDGLHGEAVVRAIIDMAHALSLEVIAEGVEREGQRRTLARLGCDQMQGFLFSPPVPPERLGALLPPARSGRVEESGMERELAAA